MVLCEACLDLGLRFLYVYL